MGINMDSNDYTNVWEYRIKEAFKNSGTTNNSVDILWDLISLLIYSSSKDRVLIDIYNFFEDKDQFVKFISLMDGRTIKLPTRKEIEENLLTAVFFYEKEVNGKTWKEIQSDLDFEISPIKYGIKVKYLSNWIKQKMSELIHSSNEGNTNE